MTDATPSHNLAAETHVLGSMLLSRDAIVEALARLTGPDFYRGSHRTIFDTISDLHTRAIPVDAVTVADALTQAGKLGDIGGPIVISDLSAQVPHASSCAWYADIVAEQAAKRRLLAVTTELARRVTDEPVADITGWAVDRIESVAPRRTSLRVLRGDTIDDLPDPSWMVEGILPEGLSMLFGPPGAGKSFIALSWACAIASRSTWFRRTPTSAPVIYIAAEGAAGIKLRRQAWRIANHHPTLDHLAVIPQAVDPTDPGQQAELVRICEQLAGGLIVWDTVARCMSGDENGTEDMKRFVRALDRVRERTGASQLVVHHTGKDVEKGARGSNVLEGACDGVMRVTQTPSRSIQLQCRKAKDAMPAAPMEFELKRWGPSAVLEECRGQVLSAVSGL